MRFVFLISSILVFLGCLCINADKEMPCHGKIPKQVKEFFNLPLRPKSEGIYSGRKSESIILGTHNDLYMSKSGEICSRKYGWATSVKFEPHLLYENDNYILVLVFSEYRVANFKYLWIVISKKDGRIVNCIKTDVNLIELIIHDDVFYFKIGYKDPRIHCMKIGE